MTNSSASNYGLQGYLQTARQIGEREHKRYEPVLLRMLAAKAVFGLSAVEYGQYGLHRKPFRQLRDFRTKKQTTAFFDRVNPAADRAAVDDKLRFHEICLAHGLPVPPLLAILSRRGTKQTSQFPVFESFGDLLASLAPQPTLRLILKPQADSLGTGVRFLHVKYGMLFDIEDKPVRVEEFSRLLYEDMLRDDYLVQEFVRPHPKAAALGSGKALGTLRILAHFTGTETRLLYALMRIPCGANSHDNFSGGSTGNLIAAIDLDTGRLRAAFGRRHPQHDRLLESFERNPDTGRPIAGQPVPEWGTVRHVVERAARAFPRLPILGWDIALSDRGVVIIEANSNPDVIGAQVSTGMGARSYLSSLEAQTRAGA
jgi:hypothetical protein